MIFDTDELPSEEELAAATADARKFAHLWKKRAACFTFAFLLSCASVSPFSYGHALHPYWKSFGRSLIVLCMLLLVPFVASIGIAVNAWLSLRSLGKIVRNDQL
jgi:hypothetical protein